MKKESYVIQKYLAVYKNNKETMPIRNAIYMAFKEAFKNGDIICSQDDSKVKLLRELEELREKISEKNIIISLRDQKIEKLEASVSKLYSRTTQLKEQALDEKNRMLEKLAGKLTEFVREV